MSHAIEFRVLELLCSRICHDLISPVTAINNGMELLEDDPGDMLDDIRGLLTGSASEGSAKLQYFRLAYGLGGAPDGEVGIGTATELSDRLTAHEKASVTWPDDRERMLPRLVIKSAMNLVLMAIEALPRGGEISVAIEGNRVMVKASGEGARIEEESRKAAEGAVDVDALTPRTIQSYFTRQVVAAAGGCIEIDAADGGPLTLTADISR